MEKEHLTEYQKECLRNIGINPDDLVEDGEMNAIINSFGYTKEEWEERGDTKLYPYVYMPRKGYSFEDEVDLSDEEEKENYVRRLRDAAQRMKIWAEGLEMQAYEIEVHGYPQTTVYYPDVDSLTWIKESEKYL